jgi:hypothetical protein
MLFHAFFKEEFSDTFPRAGYHEIVLGRSPQPEVHGDLPISGSIPKSRDQESSCFFMAKEGPF